MAPTSGETGKEYLRKEVIGSLGKAINGCKRYVALADSQYTNPLWTNRVVYVDWDQLTEWVKVDIEIARQMQKE